MTEPGMQQEWPTLRAVPAEPRAAGSWGLPVLEELGCADAVPCLHSSPAGAVPQVTMPDHCSSSPSEGLPRHPGLAARLRYPAPPLRKRTAAPRSAAGTRPGPGRRSSRGAVPGSWECRWATLLQHLPALPGRRGCGALGAQRGVRGSEPECAGRNWHKHSPCSGPGLQARLGRERAGFHCPSPLMRCSPSLHCNEELHRQR